MGSEWKGYSSPEERIRARGPANYDLLTVEWDNEAKQMKEYRQTDGYYFDEGGLRYNKYHEFPIAWRDPNEWKERADTTKVFNHPDYGPIDAVYIRSMPSMNTEWQQEWTRRQGGTASSREIGETNGPVVDGYTLHRDVPFKEIRYPYTDEDNRYHKHGHKNSYALDGRS